MPRVSFLTIVKYLESLAEKHVDINSSYRWNISEVSGAMRKGITLPVKFIDAVETQTDGDKTKTIHNNTTAFTVLGKPNTSTSKLDSYAKQNEVLDHCQQICFDIEARILHDAEQIKDANGDKNWLYGLVDKKSFHHFKVGPLFTDGLFGYRCEVTLKNQTSICVDETKWNDLN